MIQNCYGEILSPKPMYSPRKNNFTRSGEYLFVTVEPTMTTNPSMLSQHQSSSAHSVASLGESSSTSDSGFQSVAAPQALLPSPNSAFSPRYSALTAQSSLNDTIPLSPDLHSSVHSVSSDVEQREVPSPYDRSAQSDHLEPETVAPDKNDYKMTESKTNGAEEDADRGSYTRGRRRRRSNLTRSKQLETSNSVDSTTDQQPPTDNSGHFTTSTEVRRIADRKSLFDNFVTQAEERDRRARREQRAMANLTKSRTRSSSLNRSSYSFNSGNSFNGSSGLKRSNSTNTCSEPLARSGLRRSSSNVDVHGIINKAEKRDRHARVEQARLEGLVPPRRYLGRKDSVNTRSRRPASMLIKQFEDSGDSEPLTGRLKNSEASQSQDTATSSALTPRSAGSHHRKFSSFMSNSRLSQRSGTGGGQHNSRYQPDSDTDGYRKTLYRAHSARSSTWNGTEIRYKQCPPLSTDKEVDDSLQYRSSRFNGNGATYKQL